MKLKELEVYTERAQKVAEFREKNRKVFEKYEELLLEEQEAEGELKKVIKEEVQDNVSNDYVRVVYSRSFSKSYDADAVRELASPKAWKAIEEAGAVTRKIDTEKFEALVEQGIVPIKVKQEAFREVEGAPRVSIKENK